METESSKWVQPSGLTSLQLSVLSRFRPSHQKPPLEVVRVTFHRYISLSDHPRSGKLDTFFLLLTKTTSLLAYKTTLAGY